MKLCQQAENMVKKFSKHFKKFQWNVNKPQALLKKTLEMCHCLKNIAAYFKSLTLSEA